MPWRGWTETDRGWERGQGPSYPVHHRCHQVLLLEGTEHLHRAEFIPLCATPHKSLSSSQSLELRELNSTGLLSLKRLFRWTTSNSPSYLESSLEQDTWTWRKQSISLNKTDTQTGQQHPKDPQLLEDPNCEVPDSVMWRELSGAHHRFNSAFLIQDLDWDHDRKLIKSEEGFYILLNTTGIFN